MFSKDLNYFFEPEPQTLFRVHRGKDRVRLPQSNTEDPAYFFESLGYMVPDRLLDPYFAEFLPHKAGREPRAHQHVGCEFLYLLSGRLDLRHGETMHSVEAGDAVYFDADDDPQLRLFEREPGDGADRYATARSGSGAEPRKPDGWGTTGENAGDPGGDAAFQWFGGRANAGSAGRQDLGLAAAPMRLAPPPQVALAT